MNEALAGTPITPFRYPNGVKFSTIDPDTGVIDVRRVASDGRVIGDASETRETVVQGTRGSGAADDNGARNAPNAQSGTTTEKPATNGPATRVIRSSDAIF
jgi:hypothetical protein